MEEKKTPVKKTLKNKVKAKTKEISLIPGKPVTDVAPVFSHSLPGSDRPPIYEAVRKFIDDLNEKEIVVLIDRLTAIAQITILEYKLYQPIQINEYLTLTRYDFFELAVKINTFLSSSPLNNL